MTRTVRSAEREIERKREKMSRDERRGTEADEQRGIVRLAWDWWNKDYFIYVGVAVAGIRQVLRDSLVIS